MDLIGSAVREFETAVKVKGTPLDQGAIEKTATIVQEAVEMLIDARGGGNDPMPLALAQRLLWMNERLMAASRIDALAIYRRVGERFPAFALIRRDYLEGDARPGRLGGGGPQARPGERPLGNWGRGPSASPPANN
ncbi:MAG: hypothetical protein BWZ10_02570 [candidate division BRC1 bacterium ADurb.BinA364]|nr:MAG: hypothetical protein BWZ10_02570 [candidate division BRC1 bacterium ADurb.BinA364]